MSNSKPDAKNDPAKEITTEEDTPLFDAPTNVDPSLNSAVVVNDGESQQASNTNSDPVENNRLEASLGPPEPQNLPGTVQRQLSTFSSATAQLGSSAQQISHIINRMFPISGRPSSLDPHRMGQTQVGLNTCHQNLADNQRRLVMDQQPFAHRGPDAANQPIRDESSSFEPHAFVAPLQPGPKTPRGKGRSSTRGTRGTRRQTLPEIPGFATEEERLVTREASEIAMRRMLGNPDGGPLHSPNSRVEAEANNVVAVASGFYRTFTETASANWLETKSAELLGNQEKSTETMRRKRKADPEGSEAKRAKRHADDDTKGDEKDGSDSSDDEKKI